MFTPPPHPAHAGVLQNRGRSVPPDARPALDILDSWARCEAAGLDSASRAGVPVVASTELARRRERAAVVRGLAQAELETLAQQIAGSNFLLAFADDDGVILDLYADNRFTMSSDDAGIVAGSLWSEAEAGTNGLGTALAIGRSVAVTGSEHYFLRLGKVSCTAAPVRDSRGEIVGVLDASSFFESRQRHTQALVEMAAIHIENGLLLHQMRAHLVLAIHPRREFLGTLGAGLVAFDEAGRVVAVNARAGRLLHGLDTAPGAAFETLFGESFELALARLQVNPERPLRDALGSAVFAACIGRPPRALPRVTPPRRLLPAACGAPVVDDPAVAQACRTVEAAMRLGAPVLICGETGTGKEVMARHAHRSSGRAGAFVAVNCGSLPADLVEAELFGYVGGAFTGARREGSAGLIAAADRGTLLLDEVGELPLASQATLLRFLDDGLVRAVGGTAERSVDVQVLAATNADLDAAVAARRFRADLLYRLDTVRVTLPPLRERSDFEAAARAVLATLDPAATISAQALARLASHRWPGNFRELRAQLTRALMECLHQSIEREDVERGLPRTAAEPASDLQRRSSEIVRCEFERSGGSVARTARVLGISRTTVYRHLKVTSTATP